MAMTAAVGMTSLQKLMMRLQATTSNGTSAASKTKKFQPAAKPNASSTKRPAKRMKGEEMGKYVTISAMETVTARTKAHQPATTNQLPFLGGKEGASTALTKRNEQRTWAAIQETFPNLHLYHRRANRSSRNKQN